MGHLELATVLASALLHALWNTFAKSSRDPLAFLALLLLGTVVVGAPALAWMDLSTISSRALGLIAATSAVHAAYNVSLSLAYQRGELSVVYPISRSTPALVALIAVPLFDDPVSAGGALGIAIVVVGVWLVHTRGRLHRRALVAPGVGYAYLTLALTAAYSLLDKQGVVALLEQPAAGPVPVAAQYFLLMTLGQSALFLPFAVWRTPRNMWRELLFATRRSWTLLAGGVVALSVSYGLILKNALGARASSVARSPSSVWCSSPWRGEHADAVAAFDNGPRSQAISA